MSNHTTPSYSSLYAIFDVKAGSFGSPFVARNDDDAKRSIAMAFGHPSAADNVIARFPEDFTLVNLCGWSPIHGIGIGKPETIATLAQILKAPISPVNLKPSAPAKSASVPVDPNQLSMPFSDAKV